ncbi:hypothetical protein CRI70_07540 [Streptomyces sp. Ru87]|nr:hypothetical protein CRI70_07540 [Streptomyces sp. Ru87]
MSRVVDATEDFVDDVLENADDLECDVRHSFSKALDCKDDDDWDDDDDGDWDDDDSREPRGTRARRGAPRRTGSTRSGRGEQGRRRASGGSREPAGPDQQEVERLRRELAELADKLADLTADRR